MSGLLKNKNKNRKKNETNKGRKRKWLKSSLLVKLKNLKKVKDLA